MEENKRKGLSRTKTIGALKHSEAEYIQVSSLLFKGQFVLKSVIIRFCIS